MAPHIPGEDANLIEVKRQAIPGFGEDGQVLRDFLVSILNLIQHEERDNPLAFRVLGNLERDVKIDHAGQYPADTVVRVAHQPPVFDYGNRLPVLLIFLAARLGGMGSRARQRRNPSRLLGRASLQQRQLLAGRNLIEMFGIAPRFDVQIRVIARHAPSLHGIVLVVRGQLLDLIEDFLTDKVALLHPSRRAVCSAHFDEAAVMVEHFHALAILHHSGFFIHRSHVVAQCGLNAGNVGDLEHAPAAAIARGRKEQKENRNAQQRLLEEAFHGLAIQYNASPLPPVTRTFVTRSLRLQHPGAVQKVHALQPAEHDCLLMQFIESHPHRLARWWRLLRSELDPVGAIPKPGIVYVEAGKPAERHHAAKARIVHRPRKKPLTRLRARKLLGPRVAVVRPGIYGIHIGEPSEHHSLLEHRIGAKNSRRARRGELQERTLMPVAIPPPPSRQLIEHAVVTSEYFGAAIDRVGKHHR